MNAKLSGIKKHFPKLAMTVAVLLSFLPASAYDFEVDGIYYNIADAIKHEVAVTYKAAEGETYSGNINIPPTVMNEGTTYTVTSIGIRAFYESILTSVTIPNTVTSIGKEAFWSCDLLRSITLPNSLIAIRERVFGFCESLTRITIPNSVTSIGEHAFWGCSGLTSITIPNSVTSIGKGAFSKCSGLTSITIPNSVTSIGVNAFYECYNLTSVTIPNSVTYIGSQVFYDCPLKSVYCHWGKPLSIDRKVFSDSCYEEGTLYVPKGCADNYKSTWSWSEFWNIDELDNLGVEDIMENQLAEGYIVYDLKGVLLLKTADMDEVKQLPAGLYIVNGKKVLIR